MKALKTLAIGLGVMLVFAGIASADQTLDFEGFADSEVFTNTQYAGIDFQGAKILKKSTGSLNWSDFPPHSGDAVIYNETGPMELLFADPVQYFSGYVTYNSGMLIQAYDALDNLIGSATGLYNNNYVASGNPPSESLIISAGDITRVVLTGGTGNNFTLDDVQFTGSTAVPEPATLLLLGIGLLGVAYTKKVLKK